MKIRGPPRLSVRRGSSINGVGKKSSEHRGNRSYSIETATMTLLVLGLRHRALIVVFGSNDSFPWSRRPNPSQSSFWKSASRPLSRRICRGGSCRRRQNAVCTAGDWRCSTSPNADGGNCSSEGSCTGIAHKGSEARFVQTLKLAFDSSVAPCDGIASTFRGDSGILRPRQTFRLPWV